MKIKNSIILIIEKTDFLIGVQKECDQSPHLWGKVPYQYLNSAALSEYLSKDIVLFLFDPTKPPIVLKYRH